MIRKIVQSIAFVSARYGGGFGGFYKAAKEAVTVLCQKGPYQFFSQIKQNVRSSEPLTPGLAKEWLTTRGILPPISPRPATRHTKSVAIVICVHNAGDDVQRCLASVVEHTPLPYRLILIDDGSEAPTRDLLRAFAHNHHCSLLRNELARGYTLAANQGLEACPQEDYLLLLNSDTIVGPEWLDRLIQCAESSEKVGIAGPLSNTASWQSVPELEEEGDWASNPLPPGTTVAEMARLIADHSPCLYPRLSFLNGFCLLIKQALRQEIGGFDEINFGRGFCEENDFCLRARLKGWELAVADDVYVYHAQSKSYSNERRKKLAAESYQSFLAKYSPRLINEGVEQCRLDRVMLGIRARAAHLLEFAELTRHGRKLWQGKKVAFVLPAKIPGGGSNIVVTEATAMLRMGVEVSIINLALYRSSFTAGYPQLKVPLLWAINEQEVPKLCAGFDAIIATACQTVQWLLPLAEATTPPTIGYYIQDYEPYFYPPASQGYATAEQSYSLFPGLVLFTKTNWNREELSAQLGLKANIIGVSCNNELFRPYPRTGISWPDRPLRLMAMIRPSCARRSPALTMRVLKKIQRIFADRVEIVIFGVEGRDPALHRLEIDFPFANKGIISSEELVTVLNECDIFADFSEYQAMGLTAMEAMACGLAVIAPLKGGAHDFASDRQNCLLVDTNSEKKCFAALCELVENHELRLHLQRHAIENLADHAPVRSAYKILEYLFGQEKYESANSIDSATIHTVAQATPDSCRP